MRGFAALLFSGLVAFTATAGADPEWHRYDRDHDRYDRHGDYDRRVDEGRGDRGDYRYNVDRNDWVMLARGVVLDRRMVEVHLNNARLRTIELQAVRGGADIVDVGIVYSDGTQEPIQIRRPLDARHAPNLRFDVPRGMVGVREIVVEGTGRVAFRVIGS